MMDKTHEDALAVLDRVPDTGDGTVMFADGKATVTFPKEVDHRLGHPEAILLQICPHVTDQVRQAAARRT